MIAPILSLLAGAATWTLVEYLLHRLVFHGRSPKTIGAGEHRQHHAHPDYFAPWWQKAMAALAVTAVMLPGPMIRPVCPPGMSSAATPR